ncbi:MAG: glycosyltransferase family 2 protein [Bacteroidia bacterium]|nr:glycosyltransferase family 2 protein [Bacteroidia bacterium]
MPKISIIIPCYFNEENIPITKERLLNNELLFDNDVTFEYVMVDDGSKDNTLAELIQFKNEQPNKVKVIQLAGNVGSYNAILAGMAYATGDCCVVIAADLQDPPELMVKMYEHWKNGIKLIVGNRADREESFFQKAFSNTYHKLIQKFALKNIPNGGFDYVFFDKQLKDEVVKINEKNTNTLYLLAWLNYDMVCIPYTRVKREVGKSRWTLQKKIKLFIDSFISFSYAPLKFISVTGILLGIAALLYSFFIIFMRLTGHIDTGGWSSLMVVILFVSSFQMIGLGIIGEYVWRNLEASRNRPVYVVEKVHE